MVEAAGSSETVSHHTNSTLT